MQLWPSMVLTSFSRCGPLPAPANRAERGGTRPHQARRKCDASLVGPPTLIQQDLCLPPSECYQVTVDGTTNGGWQVMDATGAVVTSGAAPCSPTPRALPCSTTPPTAPCLSTLRACCTTRTGAAETSSEPQELPACMLRACARHATASNVPDHQMSSNVKMTKSQKKRSKLVLTHAILCKKMC